MVVPSGAPEARSAPSLLLSARDNHPPESFTWGGACAPQGGRGQRSTSHRSAADVPSSQRQILREFQRRTTRLQAALGSAINRKDPQLQAGRTTEQVKLTKVRSAPLLPKLPGSGTGEEEDAGLARSEDAGHGLPALQHPAHPRSPAGGSPELPRLPEGNSSEEGDPKMSRRPRLADGKRRSSAWAQQELPTVWEAHEEDVSPERPQVAGCELSRLTTEQAWHLTTQATLVGSHSAPEIALRQGGSGEEEGAAARLPAGFWDAGHGPAPQRRQGWSQAPWTAAPAPAPEVWSDTEPLTIQLGSPAPPQALGNAPGQARPISRRFLCGTHACSEEDHDIAQPVARRDVLALPQAQASAAPLRGAGRELAEQRRTHWQPDQPAPRCQPVQPASQPHESLARQCAAHGTPDRSAIFQEGVHAPTGLAAVAPQPRGHRRSSAESTAHGGQPRGLQDGTKLWCSAPPSTQHWCFLDGDFMNAVGGHGRRSEPLPAREYAKTTASFGLSRFSFPRDHVVAAAFDG